MAASVAATDLEAATAGDGALETLSSRVVGACGGSVAVTPAGPATPALSGAAYKAAKVVAAAAVCGAGEEPVAAAWPWAAAVWPWMAAAAVWSPSMCGGCELQGVPSSFKPCGLASCSCCCCCGGNCRRRRRHLSPLSCWPSLCGKREWYHFTRLPHACCPSTLCPELR